MKTRHQDILNAISRMMWLSTTGVAEAIEPLGYGGSKSWNEYRDMISKDLGYLKSKGLITGEDRPQTKGKPLRFWSLANPQSDCQSTEMASDVAEIESVIEKCSATVQENLTVADADMVATLDSLDTEREIQERKAVAETATPEPTASVEVKVEHKTPMTVPQALAGFCGAPHELNAFLLGVAFAEKHHGISQ